MKQIKLFLSVLTLTFLLACSTSSDDNGNSTTTVVPMPPTNLIGTVASLTQINLSWTDNSTNETGFKIDRKVGSGNWVTDYGIVSNADVINFSDTSVSAGITYSYRVSSFNSVGKSLTYTNEVTLTPTAAAVLPTLTTTVASTITVNTAVSGGTILSDGGAVITAKGVCWNTSANPTIALTTKTNDGSGVEAFISYITSLTANTTYYVRAYVTNSAGTTYGNEVSFTTANFSSNSVTDIDGNTYQLVTICSQKWTQRNLNVSKYTDGTSIPQTSIAQWTTRTTGAWCYYNDDPASEAIYGKLYNWYAVAGIYNAASASNPALRKKLAPSGWHIPTDAEWTQLTNCLGGAQVAGGKMKSTGTIEAGTGLWHDPNFGATNESGFTGIPGGSLYPGNVPSYNAIGMTGGWWSSSILGGGTAWNCYLTYDSGDAGRGYSSFEYFKSVRCVRD